jgi:hypothetical protein
MPTADPALRSRPARLVAGAACALLLTACSGGDDDSGEAAGTSASSEAPTSSSAPAEPTGETSELAAGLLPDEAFGEGATVIPLTREQLRQGAGLAADPESLDIEPESCAAAVSGTQPQIDDYDDVAAVSATVGATTTVEVLLQGKATTGSVAALSDAAQNCPEARITSPELGEATLTFENLDVPDLGDGVAAVRYTTTVTQGGQEVTVPALVGLVEDGDRVVTLLTIATDGSDPDAAAFTSMLEQAFEVQAEELG